jgi:DNA-binding response OmpR family regulator
MSPDANPNGVATPGLRDGHRESVDGAPAKQTRVLVIEDDPSMKHMLVNSLEQHNMQVTSASQRQDMVRQFATVEPNVVILDLRLGQEDGLDLLREIRSQSDVPIIITTGHRRDEIDRVVGLELGADDYVTKPFGVRELVARIRAVLRRREAGLVALQREAEHGRYRFWQLGTGSSAAASDHFKRRSGDLDERRILPSGSIYRSTTATIDPRTSSAGNTRSRGRV